MGSLATPLTKVRPVYSAGMVSVASASPPVSTMLVMMGKAWTLGIPSTAADRIKVSNRLVGFMLLLLLCAQCGVLKQFFGFAQTLPDSAKKWQRNTCTEGIM